MAEDSGNAAPQPTRGATIGRYLVLNLLGRGGMGEVYAAYDPELDRKVAIKVLHGSASAGAAEGRARILREAQALAQLSDPNVVAVYDVGTYGERVFLAMEFVDGSTLSYWQQALVRSWREIVEHYSAAGRGLAAAHKRGLIHRDFKPENAMVGRDRQVRVMDFGLARSEAAPVVPGLTTPTGSLAVQRSTGDVSTGVGLRSPALVQISATPPTTPSAAPVAAVPSSGEAAIPKRVEDPAWSSETRNLAAPSDQQRLSPVNAATALGSPLTQSGAMMGTPAYMAPEQLAGKVADAKSDQFSFCVALYEALYGERPFGGKSLPELTRNVMAGRVREAPASARTPGWVRRVVLRGLRVNRDERFASMEALLDALARDPSRRRRRYLAAASVVGLIVALTGGLIRSSQRQKLRCLGADAKLAGVWELAERPGAPLSTRKESVRQAFLKTRKGYAADAFTLVRSALDRYVGAWNAMHRDACEATHLRGEQSGEVLDLRMTCLQDRFNEVRALVSVFSDANGDVVSKAAEAVQNLRPIEPCADVVSLKAVVRPPDVPAVRRAVADARVALAEVKAMSDAGKGKPALDRIGPVLEAARRTKYEPLIAEALLESAEVSVQSGDFIGSEAKYEEAAWLAESFRHDEVLVKAATELVYTTGYVQGRFAEGERWGRLADAVLRRLGPGHDLVVGWLANNRALVYEKRGMYVEALSAGTAAVEAKTRALGKGHFDVGISQTNLADVLLRLGDLGRASQALREGLETLSDALGADHPRTAAALSIGADIANAKGDFSEGAKLAERALAIWTREWGAENPAVAYGLTALGTSEAGLGQNARAVASLERALKIRGEKDPEPELLGETRFELARALWAMGGPHKEKARLLAKQASRDYQSSPASAKSRGVQVDTWIADHASKAR